ncbi:MAG: CvpA family protein [Clostridia bacterium]|nr:CvpA family protein [Clostridia bacterium]
MAYIVDIVLVAIFAVVIISSIKKGFFRSLFDLIGSIVAFILARILASSFAPSVFGAVLEPVSEQYLASTLSDVGTTDYTTQVEQALSSIPESLSGIMQIMGISTDTIIEKVSSADLNGDNLVESIMNTVVEPVGTAILQFVITAILAVVLIFVIRIVVKVFDKVISKLPVINKFNSLLGAAFGALRGIIIVAAVAMLISVVAGFINNEAFIQSVDNSIIVNTFEGMFASISGMNF